ncbi:hypothetical protein KKC22_20875 [Myxococcota bacterium]|nr:hypothetical protein [Myxococcota bacterium]
METIKTVILLCATSTIIFSSQGYCTEIDQTKAQKTHTQRQGPPLEAYTACKDKKVGESAEFVSQRGEIISGTCKQEGDRLVLRPDSPPTKNHNGDKHQEPPPEAYTACQGKNVGDVAEFVNPEGKTMSGTCEQDKDRLVLRPTRSERNSD